MLHYVIQVIAFQLIFLLAYDVFLRRETFFDWNRLYLLLSSILSLVIPFLKFDSVKNIVSEQFVIRLPEIIIGDTEKQSSIIDDVLPTSNPVVQDVGFWSWELLLYVGMGIAALLFAIKLIQLLLTLKNNPKRWRGDLLLVRLIDDASAYSFFHYVFLGDKIPYSEQQNIIKHEQVHARQKHTLDLLFFEVLRIVFWFNPLVYIYQYRTKELHEFIADGEVTKQIEVHQYCQQLLSELFQTKSISFINPFIKHSLIKKRIVMLQKTKSKQVQQFKYLLIVPIVFGMLLYTASYAQQSSLKTDQATQELSGEALVKKYYDEFVEVDNTGGNVFEFYSKKGNIDNYILTRSEFYRTWAIIKLLKEKGQFDGYEIAEKNRMPETYDEYLQHKKTKKAKQTWESQARGGDVRLVVDDIKNLTATEQQRRKERIDLILNDDFFSRLVITDGKTTTSLKIDGQQLSKAKVDKSEYGIEVPFYTVEEVPTFTSCDNLATNKARKQCMVKNMQEHVVKNFNANLAKELGLSGKVRIFVTFKISKTGKVENVRARAPHTKLEKEAVRVVASLPTFIPGKQKGKLVTVPYSLPIMFKVNE